jgi:hypothetical protein
MKAKDDDNHLLKFLFGKINEAIMESTKQSIAKNAELVKADISVIVTLARKDLLNRKTLMRAARALKYNDEISIVSAFNASVAALAEQFIEHIGSLVQHTKQVEIFKDEILKNKKQNGE